MRVQPRPAGGRPRLLDQEDVVAAALDLLDAHGYTGLSMRRLAGELLVSLPTVYAAIGSRARLLVEVIEAALARSPVADLAAAAGPAELQAAYEWFEARPWLLAVVTELPPSERRQLWARESTTEGLVDPGVVVHVVDAITRLVEDGLSDRSMAGTAMAALLGALVPGAARHSS
jgi:AcrR family transcriptional regulator